MYRAKSKRLKELIAALGEGGLAMTSLGAKISLSTLEKMMADTYPGNPRSALRERLSKYFDVRESDLFEIVGAKPKRRAS